MRHDKLKQLRATSSDFILALEQLEHQMQLLNGVSDSYTELWRLTRLLYSLNEQAFCQFLDDNKNALQNPSA